MRTGREEAGSWRQSASRREGVLRQSRFREVAQPRGLFGPAWHDRRAHGLRLGHGLAEKPGFVDVAPVARRKNGRRRFWRSFVICDRQSQQLCQNTLLHHWTKVVDFSLLTFLGFVHKSRKTLILDDAVRQCGEVRQRDTFSIAFRERQPPLARAPARGPSNKPLRDRRGAPTRQAQTGAACYQSGLGRADRIVRNRRPSSSESMSIPAPSGRPPGDRVLRLADKACAPGRYIASPSCPTSDMVP